MTPTVSRAAIRTPLLLVLVAGPSLAAAQVPDDPGLATAPAAAPPAAPPAATASRPAAAGPAATAAGETAAGGDDRSTIHERLPGPTVAGPLGLLRTLTTDVGPTHSFRIGLHVGGFRSDSFLIAGGAGLSGDRNSRFTGDLTIGYTPWKYLELYVGLFNSSNRNVRRDPGRTDPEVILSLGDVAFGVKGRYGVARFVDLGLHLGVRLLNSVGGVSFSGDSTNFSSDLLASFDLRRAPRTRGVPLRLHVNFGFLLDNSLALLPSGQCALSTGNDPCIRSRVVETFAYGIGNHRLRWAIAVDAPIVVRRVGLQPFAEYHAELAVGDGDETMARVLGGDPTVPRSRITGRGMQYLTLGLRVRPVAGLMLDAAIDVGLQSPGFQFGPPVAPWNLMFGAAYAFDPGGSRTKIVTRTITRDVPTAAALGRVRGLVLDAATRRPLGGAQVRYVRPQQTAQLTGEDGIFISYDLSPGPLVLEVSRDDHQPATIETTIAAGGESPIEVLLTERAATSSLIRVRASDEKGATVAAVVRFVSATGAVIEADVDPQGGASARLPPGTYTLEATAPGHLARQQPVTIESGRSESVEVVLPRQPTASHVKLTKDEIVLKGTILFGTNNANIQAPSWPLLDEVVDVLVKNPQVRKVRVEGHTDNRGTTHRNLELSRQRAASVVAYLVKQGIDASRLEAEGFGASRPLVPNLTPANRARNRRVIFRIVEGSGQ